MNESNSNDSGSAVSNRNVMQSNREGFDREGMLYQQEEQWMQENESNKSDQIDDGTMNVFGFNDDLNVDDRIIV